MAIIRASKSETDHSDDVPNMNEEEVNEKVNEKVDEVPVEESSNVEIPKNQESADEIFPKDFPYETEFNQIKFDLGFVGFDDKIVNLLLKFKGESQQVVNALV